MENRSLQRPGERRENGVRRDSISALQDENAVVKEGDAVFLASLKRNWWG